ncbi:MAG: hypothetical protein ACT4QD_10760 [Acidobacteriota bacterium]
MGTGNRRWTITVDTERVVVVSRHGRSELVWCTHCGEPVEAITDLELETIVGLSPGAVIRLAADGRLHRIVSSDGPTPICAKALLALLGPLTRVCDQDRDS